MQCFLWLLIPAGGVFLMTTLLRWFELTTEAVDTRSWNKLLVLVAMPFSAWFFPNRVGAGRSTPVRRHEPVRGFGIANKTATPALDETEDEVPVANLAPLPGSDGPPPGTPPEFLLKPVVPVKAKKSAGADPEKIAKLRQKMREQGMLPDERD